ncbi:MAG TPA: hypothetical protein VHY34_00345 [Caulobacteraceae bacterium]|jgi:hypothetical protein|nr:hypothetical protein [Caulobacteraceae bacterium]
MRQSSAAAARNSPGRVAAGRGQDGVVDLGQALSTAETSRLLNLTQIHLRWGHFPEHAERPLFQNKVLNRSIIMKYTPRPGELFEYAERRIKSTKILLPLDRHDLSLGSFAGVIGQKDFSRIMSRHLDGSGRLSERDERVIALIDQLPTLDPFLLYALLKSSGIDVSPVYFQLSDADRTAIQLEMAQGFAPLVRLCFPDGRYGVESAANLIDKLLNFEESDELESLRAAFRLGPDMFSAALFAWRGLIYYHWKAAHLGAALETALEQVSSLKIPKLLRTGEGTGGAARGERSRAKILKMAATAEARVRGINDRYDAAFADFVGDSQADRFRQFLINAPSLFLICGQSMAIVEHIVNFVENRPPVSPRGGGAADLSLSDLFGELERELGADFRVRLMTW